ncbi:MAG: hypothetical protein Q9201_003020 [Fulgogasparrea decipioides]
MPFLPSFGTKPRASTVVEVNVQDMDPQSASPLYTRIPPEIRNTIFRLAVTAYEDPSRRYRRDAHYYRPGYTCAHKIDTNLLLTCRLVYSETARLPASINEHTSWYFRPPPGIHRNQIPLGDQPGALVRRRDLRTIHIFAQQYWLEGKHHGFADFARLWEFACPIHLKITIRHSDWWWWEVGEPIALDPKFEGRPSIQRYSRPSDPFNPWSWGSEFRNIKGLEQLELELETVENKKNELDAIVNRASGWRFPLGDSRLLLLNKSKTKRTGWVGLPIGKFPRPPDRKWPNFVDQNFGYRDDIDGFVTNELNSNSHDPNDSVGSILEVAQFTPFLNGSGLAPPNGNDSSSEVDVDLQELEEILHGLEQSINRKAQHDTAPTGPSAPRKRLEADGVVFDDSASVPPLSENDTCTYYVVTLTWEAH